MCICTRTPPINYGETFFVNIKQKPWLGRCWGYHYTLAGKILLGDKAKYQFDRWLPRMGTLFFLFLKFLFKLLLLLVIGNNLVFISLSNIAKCTNRIYYAADWQFFSQLSLYSSTRALCFIKMEFAAQKNWGLKHVASHSTVKA